MISVGLFGISCAKSIVPIRPSYPNPCPEYANLLAYLDERYALSKTLNLDEELDRQTCLINWLKRYESN